MAAKEPIPLSVEQAKAAIDRIATILRVRKRAPGCIINNYCTYDSVYSGWVRAVLTKKHCRLSLASYTQDYFIAIRLAYLLLSSSLPVRHRRVSQEGVSL